MSVFDFVVEQYKWFIGLPFAVTLITWVWKNRKEVWRRVVFYWNLEESLKKRHEEESRIKMCPNCDVRMKVVRTSYFAKGNADHWIYGCDVCHNRFSYTFNAI